MPRLEDVPLAAGHAPRNLVDRVLVVVLDIGPGFDIRPVLSGLRAGLEAGKLFASGRQGPRRKAAGLAGRVVLEAAANEDRRGVGRVTSAYLTRFTVQYLVKASRLKPHPTFGLFKYVMSSFERPYKALCPGRLERQDILLFYINRLYINIMIRGPPWVWGSSFIWGPPWV